MSLKLNTTPMVCSVGHVRTWMTQAIKNGAHAAGCTSSAVQLPSPAPVRNAACGLPLRYLTTAEHAAWLIGGQAAVMALIADGEKP